MSEKSKSASPSAIEVKNRRKTIGTEEKLGVIMRRDKGEPVLDICLNVRLAHGSLRTIHHNADKIKEIAKSGTKVFLRVTRLPQSYLSETYQNYGCKSLAFLLYSK
jgi:hypothetical protein